MAMINCAHCKSPEQGSAAFCHNCGNTLHPPREVSHWRSIWIAIGALFFGVMWKLVATVSLALPPNSQVATPAAIQDDADRLLARCGKADSDIVKPGRSEGAPLQRWVIYKKAKVKAVFEQQNAQRPNYWTTVGFFDTSGKKRLQPNVVSAKLPCLEFERAP